jgi:nitronate monooxygenase
VLALGAEGVIVGTRLLVAEETPLHPQIKQALCEACELDTKLVLRSLHNTHRVLDNETSRQVQQLEEKGAAFEEILPLIAGMVTKEKFAEATDGGLLACGQGVGMCLEIQPMREIITDMVSQAEQSLARLKGIFAV